MQRDEVNGMMIHMSCFATYENIFTLATHNHFRLFKKESVPNVHVDLNSPTVLYCALFTHSFERSSQLKDFTSL